MPSLVQKPDLRVIQTLTGLAAHHGKHYTIPSQATILRLMHRHTGRTMTRRTLNNHLGALERDGWITRQRRHRRGKTGALELHSTLYLLKRRALAWIHKIARTALRWTPQQRQALDIRAVQKPAQSENPLFLSSSGRAKKPPPPEFKNVLEALRAAARRSKPL